MMIGARFRENCETGAVKSNATYFSSRLPQSPIFRLSSEGCDSPGIMGSGQRSTLHLSLNFGTFVSDGHVEYEKTLTLSR